MNRHHQDRGFHHERQEKYGKPITIDQIINYIEQNKKFINITPNETTIQMTDTMIRSDGFDQVNNMLDENAYGKKTKLENLSPNLGSIFDQFNFCRIGVISHVNVPLNVDVSYVSSILMLLDSNFKNMEESEQIEFTQTCIKKFHKESKQNFSKFGYDQLGWVAKDFINNVKNFKMGKDIMRYVADFLAINIFVLDNETDSLIYIGTKTFCRYKKNVFLLKIKNDKFEPIFSDDMFCMNYCSPIIKKLLNSRFLVEYMDCNFKNEREENNLIVGEEDLSKYFDELATPIDPTVAGENIVVQNNDKPDHVDHPAGGLAEIPAIEVKTTKKKCIDSDDDVRKPAQKSDKKYIPPPEVFPEYDKMTIVQLKAIAKEKGLRLSHKIDGKTVNKSKCDLMEELEQIVRCQSDKN
jgi:hypothetical protein